MYRMRMLQTISPYPARIAASAIIKAKPSGAKGRYIQSITLSASMGPGIGVETASASKLAG